MPENWLILGPKTRQRLSCEKATQRVIWGQVRKFLPAQKGYKSMRKSIVIASGAALLAALVGGGVPANAATTYLCANKTTLALQVKTTPCSGNQLTLAGARGPAISQDHGLHSSSSCSSNSMNNSSNAVTFVVVSSSS